MYEPSVVLPSSQTGGLYYLLFSTNANQGQGGLKEVALTTGTDPTHFAWPPLAILTNQYVSLTANPRVPLTNLCDIADARPIWDRSLWHVYVQGVQGTYQSGCTYGPSNPNLIFEATGPDIFHLAWVVYPGTGTAKPLFPAQGGGIGVGESMQWFNTALYGGYAPEPIMVTYNDWGYNPGDQLFGALSPDGTTAYYWYNVRPATTSIAGYDGFLAYPDAILGGALDFATKGNPAVGFESSCANADHRYLYGKAIGFFPDPVPYTNGSYRTAQSGVAVTGPLESASSDAYGPRMFRPRSARNPYGYVDPISNSPKKWQTYLYYNAGQINNNNSDPCSSYTRAFGSNQTFSVSMLTITEQ